MDRSHGSQRRWLRRVVEIDEIGDGPIDQIMRIPKSIFASEFLSLQIVLLSSQ